MMSHCMPIIEIQLIHMPVVVNSFLANASVLLLLIVIRNCQKAWTHPTLEYRVYENSPLQTKRKGYR
jgi:hypothetical protein